ncbi:hypothetical protein BC332_30027 [Capsicum chinense]|nr:hypothetical protein BC332_30027 [Capsicum chinense]
MKTHHDCFDDALESLRMMGNPIFRTYDIRHHSARNEYAISTLNVLDSCDPENYSDLIEERDDLKASQKSYSAQKSSMQNHANNQTSLVLKVAVYKQDKLFKRVMNLPWCLMTLRIIAGSSIKSMEYSIPATSIGDRSGLLAGTLHLLDCCLQIFNLKISNYNRQLPYIAIEIQFSKLLS